jgi:hypothetical protein
MPDQETACQWFVNAAFYGDPHAAEEAGYCYYKGTGVPESHEKAFAYLVRAGQAGLIGPQILVADMLDIGDGVTADPASAVKWYQAAAAQGDPYAMTELGIHLRNGQGVTWSERQAMQWFEKAGEQKFAPAENLLAEGYYNGYGSDAGQGRQDYAQAAYWYGQAAQQGDSFSQLRLGTLYEAGAGVPQDPARAKSYYAQAATSSNPKIAEMGRQFFSTVAGPSNAAPAASVRASSSSSSVWGWVIAGGLALAAFSALTSGGSRSGGDDSGGGTSSIPDSFPTQDFSWPTSSSSVSSPPPRGDVIDPAVPWRTYNGDLSAPGLVHAGE